MRASWPPGGCYKGSHKPASILHSCIRHLAPPSPCRFFKMRGPDSALASRACEANREALHEAAGRLSLLHSGSAGGSSGPLLATQVGARCRRGSGE